MGNVRKKKINKKQQKKPRIEYTKEVMNLAMKEIESKKCSVRSIAVKFNIPESTIRAKIRGKYADKKPGPVTVFTPEEEMELVNWITECSKAGFPVDKNMLLDSVQMILNKLEKVSPFVNNKPGRSWYDLFLKRHPELSLRFSENVTLCRAKVTEESLRRWYQRVEEYLNKHDLSDVQPNRIFNCDETGIKLFISVYIKNCFPKKCVFIFLSFSLSLFFFFFLHYYFLMGLFLEFGQIKCKLIQSNLLVSNC